MDGEDEAEFYLKVRGFSPTEHCRRFCVRMHWAQEYEAELDNLLALNTKILSSIKKILTQDRTC